MGYACPVCETPQQDAEHLANHLAFTAMLGKEDHETWLDEHAPGWNEQGPDELAPRVTEYAAETEYEQMFEDTVHQHSQSDSLFEDEDHGHDRGTQPPIDPNAAQQRGGEPLDAEAQQILNEAQEMTQEMFQGDDEANADSDGEGKES